MDYLDEEGEITMCPACFTVVAMTAIGAASTGGLTMLLVKRFTDARRQTREQEEGNQHEDGQ